MITPSEFEQDLTRALEAVNGLLRVLGAMRDETARRISWEGQPGTLRLLHEALETVRSWAITVEKAIPSRDFVSLELRAVAGEMRSVGKALDFSGDWSIHYEAFRDSRKEVWAIGKRLQKEIYQERDRLGLPG